MYSVLVYPEIPGPDPTDVLMYWYAQPHYEAIFDQIR